MEPALKKYRHSGQMSEAFITAAFLSVSGGLQDAYTYIARGKVFANAQTGNVILLTQSLLNKNRGGVIHYIIPLIFFAVGIAAADFIRDICGKSKLLHWRQAVILVEIILLFTVAFIPPEMDTFANAIVSFSCAMQVQAFRKINGAAFASTMCIGNIRSGVSSFYAYLKGRQPYQLRLSLNYLAIIILFAIGSGIGCLGISRWGEKTIWLSCILLTVSFLLMFIKGDLSGQKKQ